MFNLILEVAINFTGHIMAALALAGCIILAERCFKLLSENEEEAFILIEDHSDRPLAYIPAHYIEKYHQNGNLDTLLNQLEVSHRLGE